jgi:DNA-binding response OmpR family regulator
MNRPLRAIVIEDDFLLSEALKDGLESIGCQVQAQAANLHDGLLIAAGQTCDFAIVDLDLMGEMAFPVLDTLHDRGIPFVMATGAFPEEIPTKHASAPRLSKPYNLRELRQIIKSLSHQGSSQQA